MDGRKVADWGEGTTNRTFGELALLYNSPRAATVRATTDAKLWAIDRLTFRSVIAAAARAQHTKLKQALRRGILENLSDAQLDRIADAATVVRYARGDHIIRKGEEGEVFFIIESGSVICKNMSGDQANNVLHEGEYFGERALLRREPRAADVFAETDTSLIALHREDFENLLGELREVLEYNQGMRLLLCVPVLAGLAESDREALFASLRVATYEEGQVVMPDGFVPTSFYIVKEGSVAVVRKRAGSASPRTVVSDTIQMLLPGHFFPRTELATQAPLPVSYVAHRGGGSVQLFVTDRATYMRILAPLVGPTAHRGVPAVSQGGGRLGAPSETVAAVAPQPRLRVSPEPPQLLAPVAASQHLPAPTADAHQRSGGAKRSASPSKNTAATPQQPQKGATPTGRTATATAAAGGAPSRSRDAAAPPSGAVAASTAAATHAQPSAAGVKSSSSSRAAQTAVSGTAHRAAAGGASAAGTPLNAAPAPSSHSREATGVSSTSSSSAVSGTSSHTWESPASAPTHHHGRDTPPSHSASSSSQQQQRPATGGAATSGSKAPLLRHADTPPGPSLQVFMPPRRPSGGGGDWGSVASSTQAVSGGGGGRYAAAAQPRSPRRRLGIPFKELELRATLGTGTFGRVRLVYHRRSGRVFALKMLQKSQIVALKQQANIMSERELLWRCDHPFVIKLYDTYRDRDRLYMLLELVQGGELFARLQNAPTPGRIAPNDARFYGACVLNAFDYLHSLRIVYRDLKVSAWTCVTVEVYYVLHLHFVSMPTSQPENLLIDADGYLKLVDFGFAKVVNEKTYTLCGTPEYLAPEVRRLYTSVEHVDCVFYSLLVCHYLRSGLLYGRILARAPPRPPRPPPSYAARDWSWPRQGCRLLGPRGTAL